MHLAGCIDGEGRDFYSFFDGLQKEHGLKALNICGCTIGGKDWGIENNILSALYKLHNPTAYAYGSFFYPHMPIKLPMDEGFDFVTQYKELLDLGFDGIKMLETKTLEQHEYNFCVDDEYYDEYFTKCEEEGTHIIWHVADPDSFWDIDRIHPRHLAKGWYYGNGEFPSWEDIYKRVFNVLDRHPNLKVTFAHFFFYSEHPDWLEKMFEKYPNVGVDITPGAEMYNAFRDNNGFYKEFFTKYSDRITFGTDVTFRGSKAGPLRLSAVYKFLTTDEDVTVVDIVTKGIKLSDDSLDRILHKNFENLAGSTPKKVDEKKLRAYVQKYKRFLTNPDVISLLKEKNML